LDIFFVHFLRITNSFATSFRENNKIQNHQPVSKRDSINGHTAAPTLKSPKTGLKKSTRDGVHPGPIGAHGPTNGY